MLLQQEPLTLERRDSLLFFLGSLYRNKTQDFERNRLLGERFKESSNSWVQILFCAQNNEYPSRSSAGSYDGASMSILPPYCLTSAYTGHNAPSGKPLKFRKPYRLGVIITGLVPRILRPVQLRGFKVEQNAELFVTKNVRWSCLHEAFNAAQRRFLRFMGRGWCIVRAIFVS